MTRIFPHKIRDKIFLSRLLNHLLRELEESPLHVHLKALSFDSRIPEAIFHRLKNLHEQPDDAPNINAEDFHILFSNILFRYPTVRIFQLPDGHFFLKM